MKLYITISHINSLRGTFFLPYCSGNPLHLKAYAVIENGIILNSDPGILQVLSE